MDLVADIGNSRMKAALLENGEIRSLQSYSSINDFLEEWPGEKQYFDRTIVSSVVGLPLEIIINLRRKSGYIHTLTHESLFPFRIRYKTPETLGVDRLAGVAAVYNKYRTNDVLVIDAGSAITFDLLTNGSYVGGSISPGIDMRYRALNSFTGKLPLVQKDENISFPAGSTKEGINCGVILGVLFEINEYIRKFEKKYSDPVVVLTGGDSGFISRLLAGRSITDPDLIINGLNFLLEINYNAENNL